MKNIPRVALPLLAITFSTSVLAEHPIEEIEITGQRQSNILQVEPASMATPDSSSLLRQMAGADVNRNGPLTGIAQYRGMFGSRVNVAIDGMSVTSGGPNAMDTPLHYAPTALVESIAVYRGIAPVSAGQQTLGGAFIVNTHQGKFSDNDNWQLSGTVSASAASAAESYAALLSAAVANKHHKIRMSALGEAGDDYEYPDGTVTPSEYDRSRQELGYAWRSTQHDISLDFIHNDTGDTGTPALPMDIKTVDSDIARLAYNFHTDKYKLSAKFSNSDIEHVMTNYHLRSAPADTTKYRSNLATAESNDAKLQMELNTSNTGLWRWGIDYHSSEHESDISNPNNAMFFVENFNEVESDIIGLFFETEQELSKQLKLESGLRLNQVTMNSGDVGSSMSMMNPNVMTLMNTFNNSDRDQTDNNIDAVLQLNYSIDDSWKLLSGIAQKTRSATYQERYLWLPMQSTGGLADGHNYIGTPDLDPEIAHEIDLGVEWSNNGIFISPHIFYREVSDYIQGTPVASMSTASMVSGMMGDTNPLQFSNVDASFYGMDIQWQAEISHHWGIQGAVSMVRGERDDINDNLYRISPDNMRIALTHTTEKTHGTLEAVAYNKQDKVSETNDEAATAGYAIMNANILYNPVKSLALGLGIENLFDHEYQDHLGGYNRAENSDVSIGDRLPGIGRNVSANIRWEF